MSVEVEDGYYQHLRLGIHSIDTKAKYVVALLGHSIQANAEWASPTGRLVYLDLPEGRYEIYGWQYTAHHDCCLALARPLPFLVEEGKGIYIGNIHVRVLPRSAAYKIEVSDMSERDIPLVLNRLPNLDPNDVITNILED